MPFGFKKDNGKTAIDYKARLERKLYLARENPEPIFDLSECNLKSVPSNIYSLCKVFRKEGLYMQENQLSSLTSGGSFNDLVLLKVLDLSSNKFVKLPKELTLLKSLEVLNISNNLLQELPGNIGELANLINLNISNNKLKELPSSIGSCKSLQVLNLLNNERLKTLPKTLGHNQCLSQLLLSSSMIYPSEDICKHGVVAIIKFLASECGEEVEYPTISNSGERENTPADFSALQEKLKLLEKLKENKQRERLALEERLADENRKEVEMHQMLQSKKDQLVADIKNRQHCLEAEISRIQEKKEAERALLVKQYNDAEEKASETVKKLLQNNQSLRDRVSSISERERTEEQELLANFQSTRVLEKKNVLDSMNELMKEEMEKADLFRNYEARKIKATKSLITAESMRSQKLLSLIKESDKFELIDTIKRNEDLQKAAVASLLERSDTKSWELAKQVEMIQAQLAELTQLELAKKRLEVDEQLVELSNDRVALTNLLMDLFAQQSQRRKELTESLQRMEGYRLTGDNSESFWFEQYQRLLDSKSRQLVEALKCIDPDLANEFFVYGIFHCLPLLIKTLKDEKKLPYLTLESLAEDGVASEEERAVILKVVRSYLNKKSSKTSTVPSAPVDATPSAPCLTPSTSFNLDSELSNTTRHVTEDCVICLDSQTEVIFYPCGHMCCCTKCCTSVSHCPLCRTVIQEILQANFAV